MYNVISILVFIICVVMSVVLSKLRHGEIVVRILSALILVYKFLWYVKMNICGVVSIPVEISAISYFLVSAIIAFNLKKFYFVATFFGISAGVGFLGYYGIIGCTLQSSISFLSFATGIVSHGYLLMVGLYLLQTKLLYKSNELNIWVTLFAMIIWSNLFYDVRPRGATFVNYIINPTYLYFFENNLFNAFVVLAFYALLITILHYWIKLLNYINKKVITKEGCCK